MNDIFAPCRQNSWIMFHDENPLFSFNFKNVVNNEDILQFETYDTMTPKYKQFIDKFFQINKIDFVELNPIGNEVSRIKFENLKPITCKFVDKEKFLFTFSKTT